MKKLQITLLSGLLAFGFLSTPADATTIEVGIEKGLLNHNFDLPFSTSGRTYGGFLNVNFTENFYLEISPMFYRTRSNLKLEDVKSLGSLIDAKKPAQVGSDQLADIFITSFPIVFNFKFDSAFSPFIGVGVAPLFVVHHDKELGIREYKPMIQYIAQAGLAITFDEVRIDLIKVRVGSEHFNHRSIGSVYTSAGISIRF